MKHTNTNNTDGFVVRRRAQGGGMALPRPTLDGISGRPVQGVPPRYLVDSSRPHDRQEAQAPTIARRPLEEQGTVQPQTQQSSEKINLDLNLDEPKKAGRFSRHKGKDPKGPKRGRFAWLNKRNLKWAGIALLVVLLAVGGYFIWKFITTSGQIFQGNLVNAVFAPPKELKMDENGRSNLLLFGTSEDDPEHAGADLTDSIMVVSVDQKKKDAFMVSIPRDLYVDYGQACPAGYKGKINALYSCLKQESGEEAGRDALRKKVGEVLGLDVQYVSQVNYAALREAVDAVGGITVTIESDDPRGILDRNFDWDCPKGLYSCYNVKYPNGPANLNGKQALYLARARGANGDTYGLAQANFDREKYQRAILVALKDKAASAGTLTNPGAINGLLDTLGKNVRTNFDSEEIKTLIKLAQDVNTNAIKSIPLNDAEEPLVTTGNVGGASIVRPTLGLTDFSGIHTVVTAYSTGDTFALEKAKVDVLNASPQAGVATTKSTELVAAGIIVGAVDNAPAAFDTAPVQIYDLAPGKNPGTRKKLEELLGVTAKDGPPAGVSSDSDFVVIVGTAAPEAEQ